MMVESDGTADATRRLNVKKQTLDDAYAVPANFLEIDVVNPLTTMAAGKKRYTDYEVRMRVSNVVTSLNYGVGEGSKVTALLGLCKKRR